MAINLPIENPNVINALSIPAQTKTLHERGILLTTLQYSMRDADGGISRRQVLLPTDMPISPQLKALYDETLKFVPANSQPARPWR